MKLLVLTIATFLFNFSAQAASHKQFTDYLKRNHELETSNLVEQTIYEYATDLAEIDEGLFEQLYSIAQSQSEIWVDTILEGDVAALGDLQLLQVDVLKSGDTELGYHITYGQRGWDTSGCDLSNASSDQLEREETFAQCAEGRIVESAYVTADLKTYFADLSALATLELND